MIKRKKRHEKRRATVEDMSRAADAKLQRYIASSAIKLADEEPEIRREMVAKTFNFHIPSQTEKAHNELHVFIDNLAIKMLKEDPEFARTIAEAKIRQVTEEMGLHIEGRQLQRKPPSIDDWIEQFRKIKELKEVLGVKEPRFWDSFKDPQVIAGIFSMIREVFAREQPPAEDKVFVMVQESGINRLITMEEFAKMTSKEPVAYIGGKEPSAPDNEGKSNDAASEPETPGKTASEDGETAINNTGD